jgi:hypothetical protein
LELLLRCSLLHAEQKQHSLSFRWNSIRHFSSSSFSARLGWLLGTNQSAHTMHFSPPRAAFCFFYLYTHTASMSLGWFAIARRNPNAGLENKAESDHKKLIIAAV